MSSLSADCDAQVKLRCTRFLFHGMIIHNMQEACKVYVAGIVSFTCFYNIMMYCTKAEA